MGEAGIRDWFGQQLLDVKEAIGGQGRLRGAMTVFYLLGPFFMMISIIWTCFGANLADKNNVLVATCFMGPFGFFFQVQFHS